MLERDGEKVFRLDLDLPSRPDVVVLRTPRVTHVVRRLPHEIYGLAERMQAHAPALAHKCAPIGFNWIGHYEQVLGRQFGRPRSRRGEHLVERGLRLIPERLRRFWHLRLLYRVASSFTEIRALGWPQQLAPVRRDDCGLPLLPLLR